jgi:hypothetical protein
MLLWLLSLLISDLRSAEAEPVLGRKLEASSKIRIDPKSDWRAKDKAEAEEEAEEITGENG